MAWPYDLLVMHDVIIVHGSVIHLMTEESHAMAENVCVAMYVELMVSCCTPTLAVVRLPW